MATAKQNNSALFDPSAGALSATASPDADVSGALAKVMSSLGRNQQDEDLAFAAGLLEPSSNGTSSALGAAFKAQSANRAEKDKLMAQYMPHILQTMQAQQQQVAQQKLIQGALGPGGLSSLLAPAVSPGAFVPPTDGNGPTMPMSMAGLAQPGSGGALERLNPGQLAALQQGGVDLTSMWKMAHEGFKRDAGSYVEMPDGTLKYIEDPTKGVTVQNGVVKQMPGAANALAGIEGMKTMAQEAAKAGFDLVKEVGDDGAERYVLRAKVVADQLGKPQAAPNPGAGRSPYANQGTAQDAIPEQIRMITAEMNDPKTKDSDKPALQREIDRLTVAAKSGGEQTGSDHRATPTTVQKLAAEAGSEINKSWMKTSYEPTIGAATGARDLVESVRISRKALENMGSTGWGTEAKATGASVLSGLGIASDNAKNFAANAEVFQKTAMERLWSTLNEAKGPQTEGDASRASKTYAQLSNTPKANEFILDLAEAKAARDVVKARFYQNAVPIARAKGDLQEVDRKWAEHAPSIFAMPSMQRWKEGIK